MKHLICAWINGSGNQKTSNVMDHAILSIVIANDCIWLYEYCRFNKYSEISVTGQCQINIYLPDPEQDYIISSSYACSVLQLIELVLQRNDT